tara:strand:- start:31 stop:477 length:447 start_codon:yes stop_codon:yes gene_type:complete
MKKIGEYTARGNIDHNTEVRINLDDGNFKTAYVIKKFYLYPNAGIGAGNDSHGVLYTESGTVSSGLDWDWAENTQIGWAAGIFGGGTTFGVDGNGIVDPDNMIVQDLYIKANHSNSLSTGYMIVMEKYQVEDWSALIAMVRNKAQALP